MDRWMVGWIDGWMDGCRCATGLLALGKELPAVMIDRQQQRNERERET